jgi:hypothetical protein
MRYLAKARMLSYDFLSDDLVYSLAPIQVCILTGMIARADNLGRMPGEPSVLLSYLFWPRPVRSEFHVEAAKELLTKLASRTPPLITWYQIGETRYIEFANWAKHQPGIRSHNRKSSLPAPDDKNATRVAIPGEQTGLFEPISTESTMGKPAAPSIRETRAMIRGLVGNLSMSRSNRSFDDAALQAKALELKLDPVETFKLARWLWNDGVDDMKCVLALIEEHARLKPKHFYAYFAKGGPAREGIVARFRSDQASSQSDSEKQEDREFLSGGDL